MCDDLVPINDSRICRQYPIEILFCDTCLTAHQRFQIPKDILFPPSYHYRAKHTADVLNGMQQLVSTCEQNIGNLQDVKVLDIGCNDGSLLSFFKDKGAITFGIEPTDAYNDALQSGHQIINDFFCVETSEKYLHKYGKPDIITFTNVFAHIENLSDVLDALRVLSHKNTTIVIENHYLGSILDGYQFDTFYHEHPRTYSYTSFIYIARTLGMNILRAEFPQRYGGNIRVFLKKINKTNDFDHLHEMTVIEKNLQKRFVHLANQIELWRSRKKKILIEATQLYGKLSAKAFPGRAAIPIRLLELDETVINAVYEKPLSSKIGHYIPGTHIPILSDEQFVDAPVLLNLAWHISNEIKNYMFNKGYKNEIIDIISMDDFKDKC
jgi:hypothetical protein